LPTPSLTSSYGDVSIDRLDDGIAIKQGLDIVRLTDDEIGPFMVELRKAVAAETLRQLESGSRHG
jgi:hypothetical protein